MCVAYVKVCVGGSAACRLVLKPQTRSPFQARTRGLLESLAPCHAATCTEHTPHMTYDSQGKGAPPGLARPGQARHTVTRWHQVRTMATRRPELNTHNNNEQASKHDAHEDNTQHVLSEPEQEVTGCTVFMKTEPPSLHLSSTCLNITS